LEKSYKVFFNQIDCIEVETVRVVGDKAMSGKLFTGYDLSTELIVYELNKN
jgi:hypothetical protein